MIMIPANNKERYMPYASGSSGQTSSLGNAPVGIVEPNSDNLNNKTVTFWVDEDNDELAIIVKYSDGTVKTAAISLT